MVNVLFCFIYALFYTASRTALYSVLEIEAIQITILEKDSELQGVR